MKNMLTVSTLQKCRVFFVTENSFARYVRLIEILKNVWYNKLSYLC